MVIRNSFAKKCDFHDLEMVIRNSFDINVIFVIQKWLLEIVF